MDTVHKRKLFLNVENFFILLYKQHKKQDSI